MTTHDDDPRPASRRIADELRHRIASGDLPPGAKLPSERDMAEQYGTARNTAREAFRLLADDGLVVAEHGRGVFVRRPIPLIRLGNDRYSPKYRESGQSPFMIECAKQGKTARFEVLSVERIQPSSDVAARLKVSLDSRSVLRRENVFYADADPVQRVTTYIPWTIAEGSGLLEDVIPHQYGIHGILEDKGYVMARIQEDVTARMPRPDERLYLKLTPGIPVLDILHVSLTSEGEPYELTRFVMRSDMNAAFYDAPVE